jgi:hypothetical protein
MIVVPRFKRLGIKSLPEQTVRRAVAMLVRLWSERIGKLPSYSLIFDLVKDFKKAWETGPFDPSHAGLPLLYQFPSYSLICQMALSRKPMALKDPSSGSWRSLHMWLCTMCP